MGCCESSCAEVATAKKPNKIAMTYFMRVGSMMYRKFADQLAQASCFVASTSEQPNPGAREILAESSLLASAYQRGSSY